MQEPALNSKTMLTHKCASNNVNLDRVLLTFIDEQIRQKD